MSSIDLSIIIVNYNVKEFLEHALGSIQKATTTLNCEIFVVDNASTDDSVRMVRERFPEVKLIGNEQNVGFAAANNQALRLAGGKFLCLINPDTVLQEDTFTVLLSFMAAHPAAGMVGCKVLNPDGTLQLGCKRSYPTPWVAFAKIAGLSRLFPESRLFGKYNLTYLDEDQVHEVEAISGSFMLLRQALLSKVGYLDENFFMYGEDLDWCFRVREAGWKIFYVPQTRIIHYKGESSKQRQLDYLREFYRAMALFVRKHYRGWRFVFPEQLLLFAIWIRAGISFMSKLLKALVAPMWDAALISISITLALLIRFGHLHHFHSYIIVDILYTFVWIMSLVMFGCYYKHRFSTAPTVAAVLMGLILNGFLTFLLPQIAFSRIVVGVAGGLNLVSLPGWRIFLKILYRFNLLRFRAGFGAALFGRRTIIVGDKQVARLVIQKLRNQLDGTYDVLGIVSPKPEERDELVEGVRIMGSLNSLNEVITFTRVQEVIFVAGELSYDKILTIMARLHRPGVDFRMVPGNLEVIIGKASIHRISDIPLMDIDYRLHRPEYLAVKRGTDVSLALVGILFFLPVFFYNLLVKRWKIVQLYAIDNKNRKISYLQFKGPGSDNSWQRWLPSLVTILSGRLSFVGPMLSSGQQQNYQTGVDLKPGITGLAQINPNQNHSNHDLEKYDLFYLKNYSPLLDLEIIIRSLSRD